MLLCIRKWRFAFILIVIGLIVNCFFDVFPFNFFSKSDGTKGVKVIIWNINGSSPSIQKDIYAIGDVILREDADILFVSEDYYECCDTLDALLKSKYPFSTHVVCNDCHYFYSKYPLGRHNRIAYEIDSMAHVINCTVVINGVFVNLVGCHLSSNNYNQATSDRIDNLGSFSDLLSYFKNISTASAVREQETQYIVKYLSNKEPTIIMGDMNDVCGSKSLELLKREGYYNAWSKGGVGYGATIQTPLPYRIDHIYYNDRIKLNSIKKIDAGGLSDHDALIGVFEIEK